MKSELPLPMRCLMLCDRREPGCCSQPDSVHLLRRRLPSTQPWKNRRCSKPHFCPLICAFQTLCFTFWLLAREDADHWLRAREWQHASELRSQIMSLHGPQVNFSSGSDIVLVVQSSGRQIWPEGIPILLLDLGSKSVLLPLISRNQPADEAGMKQGPRLGQGLPLARWSAAGVALCRQ